MRLLICAGGTGGGVYPAITVLDALNIDNHAILWVGGLGGMEESLVKRMHIPFKAIPAAGVHGVGLKKLPGNLWKLFKGFLASLRILKSFQPDALLFTGGYVAVPMAVAALSRKSLLYVPDIEPGLALKALARFASRIAITTDTSKPYFPNPTKLKVTGYPTRPGLKDWDRKKAVAYFDFDDDLPILAVAGGSKGARSINNALVKILPDLLEDMQVIHLTGHLDWDTINEQIKDLPAEKAKRYQAFPFIHEMGAVLAAADLIVSRSGASTLGEYPLFGLPAILVPYPYAWRYQKVNASYLVDRGAAVMVKDESLNERLLGQIRSLIFDQDKLNRMSQAMADLATPEAAAKIAEMLYEMTKSQD